MRILPKIVAWVSVLAISASSVAARDIDVCQGGCRSDADCKEGLTCYSRTEHKGKPRECGWKGKSPWRYCYYPDESGTPLATTVKKIRHVGTTRAYVKDEAVYNAKIKVPDRAKPGDLLILVLHRTDSYLPMGINGNHNSGWTRAGECFKERNGSDCSTYMDCELCGYGDYLEGTNNIFCREFLKNGQFGRKTAGDGRDLATAIFYKEAGIEELSGERTLEFNLSPFGDRTKPAWMFLSAIRGAHNIDPIRDWKGTGKDDSEQSVFPSIYGKTGDLLLLSQALDSGAPGIKEDSFLPPKGFRDFASMFDCDNVKSRTSSDYECDESGYLFGKLLKKDGDTGEMVSEGTGGRPKSDAMISMTIIPKKGLRDGIGRGASEFLGTTGWYCPQGRSRPEP